MFPATSPSPARVYLDNAATSFPKPPTVAEAMAQYASGIGASPGRGGYAEAVRGAGVVSAARRSIARLLNADAPERVVFTLNCTDALNLAIKGFVRHAARAGGAAPRVVTTDMEHNSVLRPLRALEERGECIVTRLPCSPQSGRLDADDLRTALGADRGAALVVTHHASNVSGTIQPVEAIAAVCRERSATLLLDAAQSLGHLALDARTLGVDMVAFPGHKGLLGPMGTGGLYLSAAIAGRIDPLREGGTGSRSELDTQPEELPDRFEAGTPNAAGIAGLGAGVNWVLEQTVESLRAHGVALSRAFLGGLDGSAVRVLGPAGAEERAPVFSLTVGEMRAHDAALVLESEFGLLTRAGLHCAPLAHRAFGTAPDGAVRVSFGAFNTVEHARSAALALRDVAAEAGASR